MAFCVKENNWNNFPVTILQVKVELAFEFYFWVRKQGILIKMWNLKTLGRAPL